MINYKHYDSNIITTVCWLWCLRTHYINVPSNPISASPPDGLREWMENPVLIVTEAVERGIIHLVRLKDCNAALAWKMQTQVAHPTLLCSASKALCWWQRLWIVTCHWMTRLSDDSVYLIAYTFCLICAAALLLSRLNGCHFSSAPLYLWKRMLTV